MPTLAEKLRRYKPEVSPEQQELAKLEVEEKRALVAKIMSEVAMNEAKAEESKSKKDALDLNYVEQDTGTHHARDMERMKAQAEGNQNLQITKALTAAKKEGEQSPDLAAAIGFNQVSDKLNDAPRQGYSSLGSELSL